MENKLCFECGRKADVDHHILPQSKGGKKTIPLCATCHSLVHDAKLVSLSELIKQGQKKRLKKPITQKIIKMFKKGIKISKIANILKIKHNTIIKILLTEGLYFSKNFKLNEDVVSLYKSGMSKNEISKELKISRNSVYLHLTYAGLHKNCGKGCNKKINYKTIQQIKKLRQKGKSWQQIEVMLNISHVHLFRIINKHNKLKDNKYNTQNKNRIAYITLTKNKINKAKELREKHKFTWQEIADVLQVEKSTLYRHNIPQKFESLRGSLTEKKKKLAIKLRRSGKKWKEIASILEVCVGTLFSNKIHKKI